VAEQYTQTGNNFLQRWSEKASYIPYVGVLLTVPLGVLGTLVESAQWLFRGKIFSAATALATGVVSTGLNSASSAAVFVAPYTWWINAASGLTTSESLGAHGRKATEWAIGGVTGALGMKPTVLRSYPAANVMLPGAYPQAQMNRPGQWVTNEAQRKGMDPMAYSQSRRSANSEHVAALENARANPQQAYLG
jgi:hypothetical protein